MISAEYELIGFILSRGIGLIYLIAFVILFKQYLPLVGKEGIDPISKDVKGFDEYFSIFYLFPNDLFIKSCATLGIIISTTLLLGINEIIGLRFTSFLWAVLWILFLSFVNSGGVFFKPGWDKILVESGFVAIFLGTLGVQTQEVVIWLFRWILFRMMLGSAIVKIRGDQKWTDLSALTHHFETQPFPGPFSWHIHNLPDKLLRVLTATVTILMFVLPFLYFLPQPYAAIAGSITVLIQFSIIVGGNYAWLNFLTIFLAVSTFNDEILYSILGISSELSMAVPHPNTEAISLIGLLVFLLSLPAILNFFTKNPVQNMSYNPLHIGNSYGAFPWVAESRKEIIIKGTKSKDVKSAEWQEYRFKGKSEGINKRPPQLAPYHYIFEYMLFFLAHNKIDRTMWFEKFIFKLLDNDAKVLGLFSENPFDSEGPNHVKADLYRYEFTKPEELESKGNYWKREKIETIFVASKH